MKELYLCDPSKATLCIKTCCKHNANVPERDRVCECTTHRKYAELDAEGNPIEVMTITESPAG